MKNKNFPELAHKSWQSCPAFDDKVLQSIKDKLQKLWPFEPHPKSIFADFWISLDTIQMVLVSQSYPMYSTDKPYPKVQQDIWQKLEESEGWDDADKYCASTMSYLPNCLILTLNRASTTNVWQEFNNLLFDFFADDTRRWLFIAMDETSFEQCKKLKDSKHDVHYGFDPEAIREWFKHEYGYTVGFGLPF
jgi:hypothetical protein